MEPDGRFAGFDLEGVEEHNRRHRETEETEDRREDVNRIAWQDPQYGRESREQERERGTGPKRDNGTQQHHAVRRAKILGEGMHALALNDRVEKGRGFSPVHGADETMSEERIAEPGC